jgi:hypothetical protein
LKELLAAYESKQLVLFLGAGVSMGLGLPSWDALVDKLSEDLGFDPDVFKTYGSPLALADYYRIQKNGLQDLKAWMKAKWAIADDSIKNSRAHELISKAKFEFIYTTNYDSILERAHHLWSCPCSKIACVEDIAKAQRGHTQIVKLHGDIDSQNELVLGEASYFDRLQFESPLDIKLRSDTLGKSVLFLGYSLSDINVRLLFHRLAKLWRLAGAAQPKSFVLAGRPNPVQGVVLSQWNIEVLRSDLDDPSQAMIDILERLTSNVRGNA